MIIPSMEPDRELPKYVQLLSRSGCEVLSARTRKVTLDDVFLKYTGSSIEEMGQWQATMKKRRVARRLE